MKYNINSEELMETTAQGISGELKRGKGRSGGLTKTERKREKDFRKNRQNARGRRWVGEASND